MSTSAVSRVIDGYEPVEVPSPALAARPQTTMFRRRSLQPSRRAVLHVRAAGDAAVPADLAAWYTERAFHLYLAGLRLPGRGRQLAAAFADLDAACAHLRDADGMASIIVTAQGRAALAAARWRDARTDAAADALILHSPELTARHRLTLDIGCPVLVLSAAAASGPGQPGRRRGRGPARLQFGAHVTWLRLPAAGDQPDSADRHLFFDELGRWLGAYMYRQARDQLL